MLTREQQVLLKIAQRQAGVEDAEYRDVLRMVAGVDTSKAPGIGDRHLDALLSFFEAIFWRRVDLGELQQSCKGSAVFRQRGFWAAKNRAGDTSRSRYTNTRLHQRLAELETEFGELGFGPDYCHSIRQKVTRGRNDAQALHWYRAALERTLTSKRKLAPVGASSEDPF